MRFVACFLLFWSILGCNKPNPTPELSDEVYLDLTSRAKSAKGSLETEKKKLDGFKNELRTADPQSGSIKFAQKRYFESESAVTKLEQLTKYYELAAIARKSEVRKRYSTAFNQKQEWIIPEEVENYKMNRSISNSTIGVPWSSKKRVEDYTKRSKKHVVQTKKE